jgi:hypothetical protein
MHRRQTLHPRRLRRTHGADEGAALSARGGRQGDSKLATWESRGNPQQIAILYGILAYQL